MRVVQFHEFGGLQSLRLEDVAEPSPGPGEILVRITAVGLNFFDTLVLRDKYQFSPTLPFSPGGEIEVDVADGGDELSLRVASTTKT